MGAFATVFQLAIRAYAGSWTLIKGAPALVLTALAIMGVGDVAGIVAAQAIGTGLGRTLVITLFDVLGYWFAAPYLVQLYRLLLADQMVPALEEYEGRLVDRRYFAWAGVMTFVAAAPAFGFVLAPPGFSAEMAARPEAAGFVWLFFFMLLAVWIFAARTATILPAVALGREMTLVTAFNQTRGRFWFIVGAVFLPVLPPTLLARLVLGDLEGIAFYALSVPFSLAIDLLALVAGANVFRWLMENPR